MENQLTKDALEALARPFRSSAIAWKPGAVRGNRALALAYADSRYYQDRFDDDGDGYREAIRVVREDALSILHIGSVDSSRPEGITPQGQIEHDAKVLRSVWYLPLVSSSFGSLSTAGSLVGVRS